MSKIAIVGCDASGKTVFVSALTEYYKAGQRIGQTCAMVAADGATRKYTDELHHTMRILHQWPKATPVGTDAGVRKLKWSMIKDGRPITEIQLLDYGGENFRYAFRDDGTVRNAAVVEVLVNYISEADYIVITVGLDNMVRSLSPEKYKEMENGAEEYNRDSEAQWITNGLLKLVAPKLSDNPPGVLIALTQADKYKSLLNEYGGAKGLFARCWPDVDMMYPNLNVVAVASVDKIAANGQPADDYRTDGVLTVMKEFSRYTFGDCDEVVGRLDALRDRLCNMTTVNGQTDYEDSFVQYSSAMNELHEKTAIVDEMFKNQFRDYEKFLERCRQFNEVLQECETRPPEVQLSEEFWSGQQLAFMEMSGTIRGYIRFYQRRIEQRKADEIRKEEERKIEEAKRIEEERKAAEAERIRRQEEREAQERREQAEREAKLAAERQAQVEKMNAAAEMAKIECERQARQDRQKFIMILSIFGLVALIAGGVALGFWITSENKRRAQDEERTLALKKAEADKAQAEAAKAKAEVDKVKEANDKVEREKRRLVEDAMASLRKHASDDDLEGTRRAIESVKDFELSFTQKDAVEYCDNFCRKLELALGGDVSNQMWVALQHASGSAAIAVDKSKALEWYKKSAESGNIEATLMVACWLEAGMAGAKDEPSALKWYEKAANAGDVNSMMKLAKSADGSSNFQQAAHWYEKASAAGNVSAMMKLAWYYESGKLGAVDEKQTLEWYRKAADANCGDAMYRLGVFYYQGKMGLEKSFENAREMFLKAKANGCTHNDPKNGVDAWISAMDRALRQLP